MQLVRARVVATSPLAEGIHSFTLASADDVDLPNWAPGAHIDLYLPSGKVRQYSLCGDHTNKQEYEIAVQVEENGRGGSKEVIDVLRPGCELAISVPRNNFELVEEGDQYIFVAGGIGIMPILPMTRSLVDQGKPFHLYYCTRAPAKTAFLQYATALEERGLATIHHDAGQPAAQLNFGELLDKQAPRTHVYCCGPDGLMRAVRSATSHWPKETVHWEYFTNSLMEAAGTDEHQFKVQLVRSSRIFDVPPNRSILDVLRSNGVAVDSSCESGLCGTCRTRYVSGTPDHRDLVLNDTEHLEYVMICCSRARTELLVLDI
jgi:ferredoxin-NADP reductase